MKRYIRSSDSLYSLVCKQGWYDPEGLNISSDDKILEQGSFDECCECLEARYNSCANLDNLIVSEYEPGSVLKLYFPHAKVKETYMIVETN